MHKDNLLGSGSGYQTQWSSEVIAKTLCSVIFTQGLKCS